MIVIVRLDFDDEERQRIAQYERIVYDKAIPRDGLASREMLRSWIEHWVGVGLMRADEAISEA